MKINDRDFNRLVLFIRENYGINLEAKRQLIDARLSFDISRRGYTNFTKYIDEACLEPGGEACRHMINKLSTNYTFFFREPDYITQLCNTVIDSYIASGKRHIKIWCAACSSGQEPYSVAMALELYKQLSGGNFDFEIIGTDINTELLSLAERGVYPVQEYGYIPVKYRQFITLCFGETMEITDNIKSRIRWEYHNLMDIGSVTSCYDVIFCRNVMIYFTPQLRRQLTGELYRVLLPGGYLYTGSTESIDFERKYFQYISPAFYRKELT